MPRPQELIAAFARRLIWDAEELLATQCKRETSSYTSDYFVDIELFHKWCSSCRLLLLQLGQFSDPWKPVLGKTQLPNTPDSVKTMTGALKSVLASLEDGRLASFEDIVFAEAFADLAEQGEYLLTKGYHLPAAVIFRAVLETRLRRLCDFHSATTGKARSTIVDYNQALYKSHVYSKVVMKQVDMMAAVGNAAAHGSADFDPQSVTHFYSNLISFLAMSSPV